MARGKWNRSGRQSGGYRKAVIYVPPLPKGDTVYRQCPECNKIVPPYDENCDMCRVIRKMKEEGKLD